MEKISTKLYDLCIIGSGPAGIILALEYARLRSCGSVVILEFGKGKKIKNSLDDSIRIKNSANHHDPYDCTNKGLGGTSLTWGGRCVTYDEIDFIDRPILNGECTWDKKLFHEVNQYLPLAAHYFECGKAVFNLHDSEKFKNTSIAEGFMEGNISDKIIERWSMPTRFGAKYEKILRKTRILTLREGWEAREFGEPDKTGKITKLKIRNSKEELDEICASKFVIAAGAQESTRLLLRNTHIFKNLKKIPQALGKYYQGHLSGKIASVIFSGDPSKTEFGFIKDEDGVYLRRRFQFTTRFLKKKNLLNTAMWLDNPLYHNPAHKNGAMSLMYLLMITPVLGKRLAPPAIKESITKGEVVNVGAHFLNVAKDFPESLFKPAEIFYKRYFQKRKLPGVFLYNKQNVYALHFHSEQIPLSCNKMKLAKDGETLEVDYTLCDEDINSVIQLHSELDKHLRKNKCGKLIYWYDKNELPANIRNMSKDGLHQVGTIRIADSPDRGVVDKNLKIFGVDNIFVCSSAVFPTSGQANPTFYLGAFASRLAHHLCKK